MGQAAGKPRPRLHLDIGRELLQHVVEQRDLIAGIAARAGREQIGDPLQNSLALFVAAGRDRVVQFVDQRPIFSAGLCGDSASDQRQIRATSDMAALPMARNRCRTAAMKYKDLSNPRPHKTNGGKF